MSDYQMPEQVKECINDVEHILAQVDWMKCLESAVVFVVIFGSIAIFGFVMAKNGRELFGTLFKPVIPLLEGIKALAYFLHIKERPRAPGEPWQMDVGGLIFEMD